MAGSYEIPREVHIGFLDATFPIHWEYHALVMVLVWMVLVPVAVLMLRYHKPRPTFKGLTRRLTRLEPTWAFFNFHKYGLYFGIGLSFLGALVAVLFSGGFSGTVHSVFGTATVILGIMQGVSAHYRGGHGGRHYEKNDPDDPATWRGDHYDMTPRRQRFETFHKTMGVFTIFGAVGAIASGLAQYPIGWLAWSIAALAVLYVIWAVVREHQGTVYDTYRAAFGTDPEAPFNRLRIERQIGWRGP